LASLNLARICSTREPLTGHQLPPMSANSHKRTDQITGAANPLIDTARQHLALATPAGPNRDGEGRHYPVT
jgi:hypothetical protein